MPRARINVPDDEQITKKPRAPRKPRVVPNDDLLASNSRKRVMPKEVAVVEEHPAPTRKAPTNISQTKKSRRRSNKALIITLALCCLLTGSGIFVGISDKGAINVVAVVNDRNEQINRGEVRNEKTGEVTTQTLPVQTNDPRPNGGLRPAEPAPLEPVKATTTLPISFEATTTIATTTTGKASTGTSTLKQKTTN